MDTTFPKYIQKPSIVGSTTAQMKLVTADYKRRFDTVLVREGGVCHYRLYKDGNDYYAFIKVPSEVVPSFYYDVVIKFKGTVLNRVLGSLKTYNIQVFANDPAFCFTYAYSFNKNKLLIPELSPKIGDDFLKQRAIDRNPRNAIGIVKSLFFAYFIMEREKLFDKDKWEKAQEYDAKTLIKQLQYAPDKIADRQRIGQQVAERKKRNRPSHQTGSKPQEFSPTMNVKPVKKTKRTSIISSIKSVKKIGGRKK